MKILFIRLLISIAIAVLKRWRTELTAEQKKELWGDPPEDLYDYHWRPAESDR